MEVMRKPIYHATVVKNVQPDDPDYNNKPSAILVELNSDAGQYHSISLTKDAAEQLIQELSQALENA